MRSIQLWKKDKHFTNLCNIFVKIPMMSNETQTHDKSGFTNNEISVKRNEIRKIETTSKQCNIFY